MRRWLFAFSLACIGFAATASAQEQNNEPAYYHYKVVGAYPHATDAFSQGLFVESGVLYESTGLFGQSTLRRVDLKTGEVLQQTALPDTHFGEGSTMLGEDIFVLTWRNGVAYKFNADDFSLKQEFSYAGEGWGLTHNGEHLIMSDGTTTLRFLDPQSFEEQRRITVTLRGKPLPKLNELEWIDGEIFANVWQTNAIVSIDPETGVVTGILDMQGLLPAEDFTEGQTDVLNGIAYDAANNHLYVTGKNWPTLFKIERVRRR